MIFFLCLKGFSVDMIQSPLKIRRWMTMGIKASLAPEKQLFFGLYFMKYEGCPATMAKSLSVFQFVWIRFSTSPKLGDERFDSYGVLPLRSVVNQTPGDLKLANGTDYLTYRSHTEIVSSFV